jgi:membrane-associated phospholipid phosphatase
VRGIGTLAALAAIAATAIGTSDAHGTAARRAPAPAAESGQLVVDWNRQLLKIVRTPGAQPATRQSTRDFAILQAAIYDAVTAVDRSHEPYLVFVHAPRDADAAAAANAAAQVVLDQLYPAQASLVDATYATEQAQVRDGAPKTDGVKVGQKVAWTLLAIRAGDHSDATPPAYATTGAPGDYRPAPPAFATPVFTHWAGVTPFVLDDAAQFRPDAPPPLSSTEYATALNEVQSVGSATSTTRTADQTEIGKFWAAPIQNYWNEIAQTVTLAHRTNLPTTARVFAALDLSFADSAIAFYDAKYHYRLWRPVTAIRMADSDGNDATTADPGWTPLANTPADPSYPGAHSVLSAAGADVLGSFFGGRESFVVSSETLPGITRRFSSFSAAATEAGLSRIYAGIHTRLDHVAGQQLGHAIAAFVLRNALLSEHERGD